MLYASNFADACNVASAVASESIDKSSAAASSSANTSTSADDTVSFIPSDTTIVSDGVTLTGQDAVAALAAEKTSTASASATTMTTSDSKGLSSIAIVGKYILFMVSAGILMKLRDRYCRRCFGDSHRSIFDLVPMG